MEQSLCTLLEWDTEFFGKNIGRIIPNHLDANEFKAAMAWANKHQVECLYLLLDVDSFETIYLAENHGFHFQGLRTEVMRSLDNIDSLLLPDTDNLVLRHATMDDIPYLRPIAQDAYHWTRFYSDANFSEAQCQKLYDIWLTKSITENYADYVVVAELAGEAVGYMTCNLASKPDSKEGTFHLVGVNPKVRGRGIGQRVIVAAMQWLKTQGMTSVSLSTQGRNIPVIRFYQRIGFVSTSVQMWYHWWRDSD